MAQATDLYPILKAYANKKNSPYINIEEFITFLETYSARKAPEQPEWLRWTGDTEVKFWSEMARLVESERCTLTTDTTEGRIYMPHLYVDLLREAYHSIDDTADLPFPNEESLRITIPGDQVQVVKLESEMGPFFEGPRDSRGAPASLQKIPAPETGPGESNALPLIIKLIFPEGYGSALILAPMIPRRLMESALLKIRHYLRSHGNREYALHKLSAPLQGREKQLHEIFDQIAVRPLDCLGGMESFGDFAWLFWAHFCTLVKNDIKKKKEILTEDLAALQAVFVIEIGSGFFKARAVKQREREIAFRSLELRMEKPPYYYTIDEIRQFTNDKGVLLTGLYSPEELTAYLKKQVAGSGSDGNNDLPEWLIFQSKKNEHWYIKKEKIPPLCTKLIYDTRLLIQKEITGRWTTMIKEFRTEEAMEKDASFEKLLGACTAALCPVLSALLEDPKLRFVSEEMERYQKVIPPSFRIFKGGKLIPPSLLYDLRRRDILSEARLLLPFWYSIPILAAIIAFFKKLGKKTEAPQKAEEEIVVEEDTRAREGDIQTIARNLAHELVPPEQSLDEYLADLETRWSRLLNKQARQNLIEDVKALARDQLRHTLRLHKKKKISREGLDEIAVGLVSHTPALRNLGARDSLRLYLELYMVKLLMNFKLQGK
jgi:hypothetical protein